MRSYFSIFLSYFSLTGNLFFCDLLLLLFLVTQKLENKGKYFQEKYFSQKKGTEDIEICF